MTSPGSPAALEAGVLIRWLPASEERIWEALQARMRGDVLAASWEWTGAWLKHFLAGDRRYKRELSTTTRELVWAVGRRPALRWRLMDSLAAARDRLQPDANSGRRLVA